MICKNCKTENADGAKFCNFCGASLEESVIAELKESVTEKGAVVCPACKAEMPAGAKFCEKCGARLDGKKVCPSCKAEVPADAKFCKMCGARLDGKKLCPSCKAEVSADARFCDFCGASLTGKDVSAFSSSFPANSDGTQASIGDKVVGYIKIAFALLAALSVLIFTFFVKLDVSYEGAGLSYIGSLMGDENTSISIYDLFYKQFKTWIETLDSLERYTAFYELTGYITRIIGTVIAASGIICVVVFSLKAIINGISCLMGKTQKKVLPSALGAVICYIAMVALLKLVYGVSIRVWGYEDSVKSAYGVYLSLSSATVAGIVLGAVFVGISALAKAWTYVRSLRLTPKAILSAVFAFITTALSAVVILMTLTPALSAKASNTLLSVVYTLELKFSPMMLLSFLASESQASESTVLLMEKTGAVAVFSILGVVCCLAVIIFAGVLVNKKLNGREKDNTVALAVCLVIAALLYLIFTILATNNYMTCIENVGVNNSIIGSYLEDTEISFSYVAPIAIFVISVIALIGALTESFMKKSDF